MKTIDLFKAKGLILGKMVSYSKSAYREANPKNVVYFNANIISLKEGKVWYGDVDLTLEGNKLKELSVELNETLYVLREMDCRFETAEDSISSLIKKSVWNTNEEIPSHE